MVIPLLAGLAPWFKLRRVISTGTLFLSLLLILSSSFVLSLAEHEKSVRQGGRKKGVLSVIVATTSTRKGPHVAFHTSVRPPVRPSVRGEERRRATPNSQPTGRVNRVDIVPREWASWVILAIPRPDNCFAAPRAREVNDTRRCRGLSKHSLEYHFVAPRDRVTRLRVASSASSCSFFEAPLPAFGSSFARNETFDPFCTLPFATLGAHRCSLTPAPAT